MAGLVFSSPNEASVELRAIILEVTASEAILKKESGEFIYLERTGNTWTLKSQ